MPVITVNTTAVTKKLVDAIERAIDYNTLPGGVFHYRHGEDYNIVQDLQGALEEYRGTINEAKEEAEFTQFVLNRLNAIVDQVFSGGPLLPRYGPSVRRPYPAAIGLPPSSRCIP